MWKSIKKFFGFGNKQATVEIKVEANIVEPIKAEVSIVSPIKTETPKAETSKKSKTSKPKLVDKPEVKVTAKDIKSKVKKEEPKVKKTSKLRKPKSN